MNMITTGSDIWWGGGGREMLPSGTTTSVDNVPTNIKSQQIVGGMRGDEENTWLHGQDGNG